MKKSRNITISAIIAAIGFIFLYLSGIIVSAKLACLCVATACICIIIMECGKKTGFLAALVLCILSWFFVPDKTVSVLFIMFFSYYPLIKLFAEQKRRITEWVIKIVFFYVISIASVLVLKATGLIPKDLLALFDGAMMGFIAVTLLVAAECIFDYALSIIIGFYVKRVGGKF